MIRFIDEGGMNVVPLAAADGMPPAKKGGTMVLDRGNELPSPSRRPRSAGTRRRDAGSRSRTRSQPPPSRPPLKMQTARGAAARRAARSGSRTRQPPPMPGLTITEYANGRRRGWARRG